VTGILLDLAVTEAYEEKPVTEFNDLNTVTEINELDCVTDLSYNTVTEIFK
jgi:hypothetical protein